MLDSKIDKEKMFTPYMKASTAKSIWQLVSTLVLYVLLWYLVYLSLGVSYLLTLFISMFAAGMLVRLFIIFHDCGHGNFFPSHKTCNNVGKFLSIVLFVPFFYWKYEHAQHHTSVCNLDYHGIGDIWTLSIKDYNALPRWKRFQYRLWRNPLILFGMSPVFIKNRFVSKQNNSKIRHSVYWTNFWMITIVLIMYLTIGLKAYLMVQVPIFFFASLMGAWLFFIQHQFSGASWKRSSDWNHNNAVLEGTCYYKLPKLLQWFTGNIGFHHIHHLCMQIPNYNLEQCYKNNPSLHSVQTLKFWESIRSVKNRLWDDDRNIFVGFKGVRY